MDTPTAPPTIPSPWRRRSLLGTALSLLWLLLGPAAISLPAPEAEALLGIAVFPGAEMIAMEGPSPELVDLQRPGWEFVAAEVTVADFLVDAPLADLRRFYRSRCIRDRTLLLVGKEAPAGEIVSVRHAARHPIHHGKRWLRIVTYRRQQDVSP